MNSEPDVVIVGAGAAGISAAMALAGHGLDIVVIEALDRTGGRGWTRKTRAGPLDLGCGWLHSADRNPWVGIAERSGFEVVRGPTAWGSQFQDLGFSPEEQRSVREESSALFERLSRWPPASDRASDALDPHGRWTAWLQAKSGFGNGDELERISARDYVAYESSSTNHNWRVSSGYGTLISSSMPQGVDVHLNTPLQSLGLSWRRIEIGTPVGVLYPRTVIITVSTDALSSDAIAWPQEFDPWREAAHKLPLGNNEKLFLEIVGRSDFQAETYVVGNPRDPATGSYYIRPLDMPVVECFLGGAGARRAEQEGAQAAFDAALAQLRSLFGHRACKCLKPLVSSDWAGTAPIGGGYSHALPTHAEARDKLASSLDARVFFAGEATHATDFSTAHGAFESGRRAALAVIESLRCP
ncbi:FAD-dependent oxidoreductase [Mesorhizobium sp. WSM3224]|uniref:flavin monoamine oxidase family protein n=1 Tax=Mesorhizobium sp. WSM3224 TaxID=1040986 RepID=UPI0004824318|nr:FAD-dependent oxidoreductase [Mesorhizobium sp. WSM3224]